jgi:uncharacterized membrane-anchored protein
MIMDALTFRMDMRPRPNTKTLSWILLSMVCGHCFADTMSTSPYTVLPQLNWIQGPAKVELAGVADFQIPEGYRFLDAKGARALLDRPGQRTASPMDLVGIVESSSGAGRTVLEYSEIGYVKRPANGVINAASVLEDIHERVALQNNQRARYGIAPMKSINWEKLPVLNSDNQTLEYGFRIELSDGSIAAHFLRKFGRRGILAATSQSASTSEPVPLKEIMSGLNFKEGYRYSDYESGDKLASLDISQLITGSQFATPTQKGWMARLGRGTLMWFICGIGACVLALVGFLVTREIRSLKLQRSFDPYASRVNGKAHVNGNSHGRHALRRKRMFDYQKFYADMMVQVSSRSVAMTPNEPEPEQTNGEAHPIVQAQSAPAGTSELIAQQQEFIEEQRRLMVQQARLIEERSRLIEEKNQLLAKQSEMIENQLL